MNKAKLLEAIRAQKWDGATEAGEWWKGDAEAFCAIGVRLYDAGVAPDLVLEMLGAAYAEVAAEFGS